MTDKHEALIFADDRRTSSGDDLYEWAIDAEDWIRRLHAELETLRAKLKTYEDLGEAGSDVQLLRMGYAAARLEIESLRASHGQAPARAAAPAHAGEYPSLVCDYCGALTPDPWHSSGMLHGKMSKHIHSCDACCRGAAQPSPQQEAQAGAVPASEYPPLPEQVAWRDSVEHCDLYWRPAVQAQNDLEPLFTKQQMRAYVDTDRTMRAAQPAGAQLAPTAPPVPSGWSFDVKRSDGRVWLTISTPHGASATLSAAEKTGNGDDTIVAQVLAYLADSQAAPAAVAGPSATTYFENVLSNYLTEDGFIAADDLPAICNDFAQQLAGMACAVRWAPSSAYWSEQLRMYFGEDAREGIVALEKQLRDALAEKQQAHTGSVYAELPEPDATTVGLGAVWNRHSMRDFADATCALRMKAAPQPSPAAQEGK